jgi:hypothetical protein
MLYMLLLYGRSDIPFPEDGMERHLGVYNDTSSRGEYVVSEALGDGTGAKVVRNHDAGRVTDGPFLETREFLGGFYLLDCKDIDEAIAYARRIPDPYVEVRPVMAVPDWPYNDGRKRQPMTMAV